MTQNEQRAWLTLLRAPSLTARHFEGILTYYSSICDFFRAKMVDWRAHGFSEEQCLFFANPPYHFAETDFNWLNKKQNRHIILRTDPKYPTLLKETHHPPPVLYAEGQVDVLNHPQIAIVGSRNPSPSGLDQAYLFAHTLAKIGLCITSGLALGIDAAAHQGALAAQGFTIAVAGCGLDQIYPKVHTDLAERIVEQGALVSEYWPGTPPKGIHFPQRNRIVSGLSLGVLVVEAALKSGSLITARFAVEQNREVFALPGSIKNPLARGCHALIQQGAHLVENTDDILRELQSLYQSQKPKREEETPKAIEFLARVSRTRKSIAFSLRTPRQDVEAGGDKDADAEPGWPGTYMTDDKRPFQQSQKLKREGYQQESLAEDKDNLLKWIGFDITLPDELIARSGLSPAEVSAKLLELELKGAIVPSLGGYARCEPKRKQAPGQDSINKD